VWRFGSLAHTTLWGISGQRPTPEPAKRQYSAPSFFDAAIVLYLCGPTTRRAREVRRAAGSDLIEIHRGHQAEAKLYWQHGQHGDIFLRRRAKDGAPRRSGVALTERNITEAIEYAQAIAHPTHARFPETLTKVIEAAIAASEQNQMEETCAQLNHAINLAQDMGYL